MNRIFIVNEETQKQILSLNKAWANEFPRVGVQINRRTDGYSIIIDGPENEASEYINRLLDNDIELDT